jgi:hypothetical protein
MNVHTKTYLDISEDYVDNEGYPFLVGQPFKKGHHGQLWKFVHIHNSWNPRHVRDHMNKAHHAFRLAKVQERQNSAAQNNLGQANSYQPQVPSNQQQYVGNQLQYTGTNICGNPTCGVDHICAGDYNRIVRPLGYSGVRSVGQHFSLERGDLGVARKH